MTVNAHKESAPSPQSFWMIEIGAALVLFLVALPLNLGVAIASGVPAAVGLVSGIIGSLLVGPLSGSPLQVTGPDAGLGVLVLEMIHQHGFQNLGLIVLLAGIFQLVTGLTKSAHWFKAISPAVVNGMLAGMGLLIILTQFHIMLDDVPKKTGLENLLLIPEAILKGLIPADGSSHHTAAAVGTAAILIALLWESYAPKKIKAVPAALVAIVTTSAITVLANLPIQQVELPANFFSCLEPNVTPSYFGQIGNLDIWISAVMLAFVASAQSLITCAGMETTQKGIKTNYDRELVAQGLGNMVCGALGVLPIAGVLLRSMAKLQAGSRTRIANVLHGLLMLVAVVSFPSLLNHMPTSALAAMLVLTGCRMVSGIQKTTSSYERTELAVVGITVISIVCTNLFTGVLIGFGVAVAKELYTIAHLDVRLEPTNSDKIAVLHLSGAATFMQLPKVTRVLESVAPDTELHVRLDKVNYIDHGCLELLRQWGDHQRELGGELVIDWGPLETMFGQRGQTSLSRLPQAVNSMSDFDISNRKLDAV